MPLLLGATGVGKTLLLKRLQKINAQDSGAELGDPPATLPTVGTNLSDIIVDKKKVTVREMGGCMAPIWPSYYEDFDSVIFVIDAANPFQISSSCIQLLEVLSAPALELATVLILFNKIDLPCPVSLLEMKSLFRLDGIISCAKQSITVLEMSARSGQGLRDVLAWLQFAQRR
uniref:ARF like GTPase 16 n=1 Tax=Erpetoichthys calabaricus TaxID=27687 RepID=A0A8C4TQX8_ERPCA